MILETPNLILKAISKIYYKPYDNSELKIREINL